MIITVRQISLVGCAQTELEDVENVIILSTTTRNTHTYINTTLIHNQEYTNRNVDHETQRVPREFPAPTLKSRRSHKVLKRNGKV